MRNIFLLVLVQLVALKYVEADFICRAELSYKWKNESVAASAVSKASPSANAESAQSGSSETTVFWAGIEHKGPTEDEAKAKLTKAAQLQRSAADKACTNQHENLVGCIGSKFNSISSSLTGMSFSARKAMDEAIASDCKLQQGKCLGSTLSEIKCTEIVAQASGTPEAGKDSKDKKDAKKK